MSEEVKRMVIDELRAEINDLKAGVDYYEEVLRLRAQTWADAKRIDELTADNERMRAALTKVAEHDLQAVAVLALNKCAGSK